jgi:hypothetical protein
MNKLKAYTLVGLALLLLSTNVEGQNVSRKKVGDKHSAYIDSLKATPYPWRFPILGQKVRELGFDIPYPNGLMINYNVGTQFITLDNLAVGLAPDKLTNVDGIARFEHIKPFVNVVNLRYDVWLLPFLNIYVLGGYVNSTTDILLALPFSAEFTSHGKGPMVGWGVAAAGGLGPFFVTGDYNMAWTFMPQLEGPSLANVFDIRVGHTFDFKKRPASNISVMVGTQFLKLNKHSIGNLNVSEKTGMTPEKKEQALENFNTWFDELPPNIQMDLDNFYNTIDGWLSNENDTHLYYEFDKKLYYPWSMTAGVNYQVSHRHIIMALYTFLGSRNQLMISYNYRLGFKGKNMLSGAKF